MSSCFSKYPELYGSKDIDDEGEDEAEEKGKEDDVEFDQEELDLINKEKPRERKSERKIAEKEAKEAGDSSPVPKPETKKKQSGENKESLLPLPGSQQAVL